MPLFDIEDARGRKLTVEGDVAPTEADAEELFAAQFPEQRAEDMPSMQIQPFTDFGPTALGRAHAPIQARLDAPGTGSVGPIPEVTPRIIPATELGQMPQFPVIGQGEEMIDTSIPQSGYRRLMTETGTSPVGLGKFETRDGKTMSPEFEFTPSGDIDAANRGLTVPSPVSAVIGALPEGTVKQMGAGVYNAYANLLNFFLSPQGVSSFGIAALPSGAQRGLAAAFAGEMAKGAPEALQAGDEAYRNGNTSQAIEHWLGGAQAIGFAGLGAGHAMRGGRAVPMELEREMRNVERGIETQPLYPDGVTPIQISPLREMRPNVLQLEPSRVDTPALELQRTKALVDQAFAEATQAIQTPGPSALELLKARDAEIPPETLALAERPGGGEAIGGKVSFNRPAEFFLEREKKNAPQERPVTESNLPERAGADELRTTTETGSGNRPPESGQVAPEVKTLSQLSEMAADDFAAMARSGMDKNAEQSRLAHSTPVSELQAAADRARGEAERIKASVDVTNPESINKFSNAAFKSQFMNETLAKAESSRRILVRAGHETPQEFEARAKHFRETGEVLPEPPKIPDSPVSDSIASAINGIENLQKKIRGSGELQMGVPSAILDTALEAARLTLKSGKPVAEAIEAALRHIRHNIQKGKWDEAKVKALLESELSNRSAVPSKDKRPDGLDQRGMVGTAPEATASAGGAGDSGSAAGKTVESPEGQKPRSFSARATVSEKIPEPVQEQIAKDPRSSYTPQRISDVKEQVRSMSDAELGALTPESDIYTEGRAELADRLFSDGKLDAGMDVIQGVSENLTRLGQLINQAKVLNALKPENQVLAIDQVLKKAGKDPMTEAQKRTTLEKGRKNEEARKRVDDATRDWQREPTPQNAARAEAALDAANESALDFQRWAHRFEPKTTAGILKAILQGNFLVPMSHSANLAGNLSFLPARIGTRSASTAMNIIQNKIFGTRLTSSVSPISGTVQAAKGLIKGAKEIPGILRRGTGESVVGERKTQLQPMRAWMRQFSKSPDMPTVGGKLTLQDRANLLLEGTLGIPAEANLRLLGAGDRPFREAAKYRATAEQLNLAGVPKSQWDFAQKFPELFFKKEQLSEIRNQSDLAVFQRQSKTLSALTRLLAEKGPWWDFAVATIAPYKVTPWNIIGEILSYNPVVAFTKAVRDAKQGDSRSANINAAKFLVGGIMTTAAVTLYKNGLLSPSLDAKDETMKERILSGNVMPPNHINISGLKRLTEGKDPAFKPGDKTVDIMRGGGLFGAFAYMIGNIGRDLEKSPDSGNDELAKSILMSSTLEQARFGMNQSFLSGVEGLLSAVKDGNTDSYVQKYLSGLTSIAVPATSQAISRATREFKPDFSEKTIGNIFRNKLGWAGLDDYLPLKRGLWGEPMRETPEGRNALIYQLFDVSKGQQITDDLKAIEIYRLWRKTDNTRVIPTPPSNRLTKDGVTYTLTPRQHEQLAISVGTIRKEIVDSLMENPNFLAESDEVKIRVLSDAYEAGAEAGRAQFWDEYESQLTANPPKVGFRQP